MTLCAKNRLIRLAWATSFLFGVLSFDIVASFNIVKNTFWLIGGLRRITHGGIVITFGGRSYEDLAVGIMLGITVVFLILYIYRPGLLVSFVKSPIRVFRYSYNNLKNIDCWYKAPAKVAISLLSFLGGLYLLQFVLLSVSIVLNGISGLGNIISQFLSVGAYRVFTFSLFLCSSLISLRLLSAKQEVRQVIEPDR